MAKVKIIDTSPDTIGNYAMCGYKNIKNEGYKNKLEWIKDRYNEGMRYKILESDIDGAVGGIEYIPGQYAWRPVKADNYMFVHCIFIMSKKYKGQGFGDQLLKDCIKDARDHNMYGVAVVTRKGTWMAKKELFIKHGFEVVDQTKPDFELLALKVKPEAPAPFFTINNDLPGYMEKGLTIITSHQCPYTYKAITEIGATAEKEYNINPTIIELETAKEAQNTPGAFGTFIILYDGEVVADHPVSNTRFRNIMDKVLS